MTAEHVVYTNPVARIVHGFTHLILKTILRAICCCYPHFTDWEIEDQRDYARRHNTVPVRAAQCP